VSNEATVLWIETLSRQGSVLARYRVELGVEMDGEIRIGRGYDNHVVLDDPFVAASHLRLVRDETGALVAEDLDSANGLYADQDRRRAPRIVVDARRTLRIGRTRLRVRQAQDAVAPERVMRPRMQLWPVVAVLGAVLLGGEALTAWLRETGERTVTDYLTPLLGICITLVIWVSAWAIVTRLLSGRARYERHLVIALAGLVGIWGLNELTSFAAYALSERALIGYRYVATWIIAAVVVFLHLRQLSQSRETAGVRLKLKAAAVTVMALGGIGWQTLSQWESSQSSDRQAFLRGLKPPSLRVAAPQTQQAFFAQAQALKGPLDQARSQAPGRLLELDGEDD
jgi:hypothetical protein